MTDQPKPLTDEELSEIEARLQHGTTPIDRVVSEEEVLRLIAEIRRVRALMRGDPA